MTCKEKIDEIEKILDDEYETKIERIREVVDDIEDKSIPLAKIKQAREEMKECSYSLSCFNEDVFDEDERVVDLDNVLIILDKLIESEGENDTYIKN